MSSSKRSIPLRTIALWLLVLDAFGYAVLGANSRLLSIGFAPMTQVYVRISIGFLLSLLFFGKHLRLKKIKQIQKQDVFWLLVMGMVGYSLSVWFITLASLNAKLVNASIIYAAIPFVVYLYSFFLLKEKIQKKVLLLLFVSLYGIGVVASKSFLPQISTMGIGELFALISVFAGGWWSVGRKKMSDDLNNKEITVLTMLIAAIFGMIIAFMKGETLSLTAFTIPSVIIGIIIGAILNLGLTFIENFSFKHVNAVLGNQIIMTSSVFSLILGFLIYQESISFPEIVGGVIIFVSVWLANSLLPTD